MDILDFEKLEKESLGAAWARFLRLLEIYPHLSILEGVSLHLSLVSRHLPGSLTSSPGAHLKTRQQRK
jgi:hypothetical protein